MIGVIQGDTKILGCGSYEGDPCFWGCPSVGPHKIIVDMAVYSKDSSINGVPVILLEHKP